MWGLEFLPPDQMPDPNDPDYELGVLLGMVVALVIATPIWWWLL